MLTKLSLSEQDPKAMPTPMHSESGVYNLSAEGYGLGKNDKNAGI